MLVFIRHWSWLCTYTHLHVPCMILTAPCCWLWSIYRLLHDGYNFICPPPPLIIVILQSPSISCHSCLFHYHATLTINKLSSWLKLNWNWISESINPSSSCHLLFSWHFFLLNTYIIDESLPPPPPPLSSNLPATPPNSASSCYSLHRVEYHQVDSTHIQVSLSPEPRSNPDT